MEIPEHWPRSSLQAARNIVLLSACVDHMRDATRRSTNGKSAPPQPIDINSGKHTVISSLFLYTRPFTFKPSVVARQPQNFQTISPYYIFASKMLPIVLFMALLPPSLFLKYFYGGTDMTDLAVLSSVALYATLVIGATYFHRLSERPPGDTLLDLNIVPARPIVEAPTCAAFKTSLMRTFSPAKPFVLSTVPSCPNPAVYPKFEWAPVSFPVSPFVQPTCKVTAGPRALPASHLDSRRIKVSPNATLSFSIAVLILILGVCFVGVEAVSWFEEIDREYLAELALVRNPLFLFVASLIIQSTG